MCIPYIIVHALFPCFVVSDTFFFFFMCRCPTEISVYFFHLIFMVETMACDMTIIMMIILIILSEGLQGATPLIVKRM